MTAYYEENSVGERVLGLFLGPVLGFAYVVCMPFLAIVTIVALLGRRVMGTFLGLLRTLATFGWRPSEAYLSGKKRRKKDNV
ncbi:MAG: hypothetical protein M1497_12705 [Nitrospirae bacterium]|nr:hypothetical protein [Nitrospirota bacterium]